MKIKFYDATAMTDEKITYVVIVSKYLNQWLLVRHQDRSTWEIPGGHREEFEDSETAARRELYEETGAVEFDLFPICIYSVENNGKITYGKLFYAEVKTLGPLPDLEIKEIRLVSALPEAPLTYPLIQPVLLEKVKQTIS